MITFLARRPVLSGSLLLALAWAGFTWLASETPEDKASGRRPTASGTGKRPPRVVHGAGPRGAGTVALRSFVAEEKVTSQQPAVVAAALNRAANRLAGEVAAWVKG